MVIGLLTIAALPTTIAVAEGISSRNKKEEAANDEELMRRFTLECFCDAQSRKRGEIHGGRIVLRDGKLYISPQPGTSSGFPFTGFYVQYPDPARTPAELGLVSFISDNPPALNWIYIDKNTRELKHGNRSQSIDHEVGPWSWEAGEEGGPGGVAFEGAEGAVAVETEEGWELRWEDADGKVGNVKGTRMLSVSLERRFIEEPVKKESEDAAVEKKPARESDGKFEVTSTTIQKDKESNKPPTKTETKLELTRSSKTTEAE